MSQSLPPIVDELRRELVLHCDDTGVLLWASAQALRSLGARPGSRLCDLCAPGTAAKAEQLLTQARADRINGWELSLIVDGAPATLSFSAAPDPAGGTWLVGAPVPEHFVQALAIVEGAMNESIRLQRETVTQKRELERRHGELLRMHSELDDAHRGVLTLHSEIADHSDELRRQSEIKTRVVANVSHEFRTPLHSILGLAALLEEGVDGQLGEEQRKQVHFISSSAEDLLQMVNDMLDLTRGEAGRVPVRVERFTLGDFVGSLRGMLRPLAPTGSEVVLQWDEPMPGAELETDRGKLAQILRNLVANALKFTDRGHVRVRAELGEAGVARFTVTDTGVGIPPNDLDRIFEEFVQLDNPLQARHQGSGLGLQISQRLASTLGGAVTVESEVGVGSTFTVTVPPLHPEVSALQAIEVRSRSAPVGPASVLVVEDDRRSIFIYEKYLTHAGFHVVPARNIEAARAVLAHARPAAIVLDVMLENETSWNFLADVKQDPRTADIPVLVVTVTNREQKARALGADEFWLKPIDQDRLLRKLKTLAPASPSPRVLLVDDDERVHYLMRQYLRDTPYKLLEAASGPEGIAAAQQQLPHVILLDFLLRDMTAFDVLDELKADPRTRRIPVIIVTSHVLDSVDTQRLLAEAEAVISKEHLSRELAINRIRDALDKAGVSTTPMRSP